MSYATDLDRPLFPFQNRSFKLVLLVGFLVCGFSSLVAHAAPVADFELSIYDSTPTQFWVGISVAFLIGLTAAIFSRGYLRAAAVLLLGTAFTSVVSLPLLRSYYFYGEYDSLTHLGWLKDLDSGAISPFELFYPGVHELALLVEAVSGYPVPKSLLFVILLFPMIFVIFGSLVVYELTDDRLAAVIGLCSGLLLLPINQIATHYMAPHPFSETILYSALPLYLILVYVRRSPAAPFSRASFGYLFAISSVGMVFFHPMQAGIFAVILGVMAAIQAAHRRTDPRHALARNERMYGLAAFHATVFSIWTVRKPKFTGTLVLVEQELRSAIFGGAATAGAVVQHQSTSLTAVGSGLGEVFVKLFLVSALFSLLGGSLALVSVSGRLDDRLPEVKYVAASVVVLVPFSSLFFVGNASKLFFRIHGSIMVLVTILGAVALHQLALYARRFMPPLSLKLVLSVLFCLLLVHSLAVVYTSPYIYKSNRLVSQAEYTGHEAAFTHQDEGVMFAGIRTGPSRYMHAIYGRAGVPPEKRLVYHSYASTATVPGSNISDLGAYFDSDHYLIVTSRDVEREVRAYRGLRYNESELASVRTQSDVHRVQSNGVFRLYLYDQRATTDESV